MKKQLVPLAWSLLACTLHVTAQNGIITTVAGGGVSAGDGVAATSAGISLSNLQLLLHPLGPGPFFPVAYPSGVAVDASGSLYLAESLSSLVRKVSPTGIITTVAGNGTAGYSGDGGPATSAQLGTPCGLALDASGNLFIADAAGQIRRVAPNGIITTVAGRSTAGFSGDGGPATSAQLASPYGVAVDPSDNLFVADTSNNRVRKIAVNGTISTVAGNGVKGFTGDGGIAVAAQLETPVALAVDPSGNLFIADWSARIRKVSTSGIITTIVGGGTNSITDGVPAQSVKLANPKGLMVDAAGNVVFSHSDRIFSVSTSGAITAIAGAGTFGFSGDGGPAIAALLFEAAGLALGPTGDLFFSDTGNNRIRKVSAVNPTVPTISPGKITPIYSSQNTIQPGEWVTILGSNLATAALTGSNFPTSLGGTSVTINGKPAYLLYVSPTQINLQAPDDTAIGTVPVVVTTPAGTASSTVTLANAAPSFSLFDAKHVAGIILRSDGSGTQGGGTYDILGPTGNSLGYPTVAARPGDTVELFGVGFGPTNPAVPAGQAFAGAAPTNTPVNLLINNVKVIPSFAGLSSAGLYQINLVVPVGLGTGDLSLVATSGSAQTQPGVVTSLQAAPIPPQVQSLSLSPATASGGATITGTIGLTAAAPAGGAVVSVVSSSAAVVVPATVTIPAGASSATFQLSVGTVTANQTVTVTASYGGKSVQATAAITPPPAGILSVGSSLGFNVGITVGAPAGEIKTYTVSNSGNAPLSYTVTANVAWLSASPASGTLAPGAAVVVSIRTNTATASLAPGSYDAVLTFSGGVSPITRSGTLVIVSAPSGGCQYVSAGPYNFQVKNLLSTDILVYFGDVVLPSGQHGSVSFGAGLHANECNIVGLPLIATYSVDVSKDPGGTVIHNTLTFSDTTSGFIFNGRSAYTLLVTSGSCSATADKNITFDGKSVYSICLP